MKRRVPNRNLSPRHPLLIPSTVANWDSRRRCADTSHMWELHFQRGDKARISEEGRVYAETHWCDETRVLVAQHQPTAATYICKASNIRLIVQFARLFFFWRFCALIGALYDHRGPLALLLGCNSFKTGLRSHECLTSIIGQIQELAFRRGFWSKLSLTHPILLPHLLPLTSFIQV